MLRQAFTDRLKRALKARDGRTLSTTRLILAGLKDRDIAARGQGNAEGISETEIQRMLQAMIKQRRESIGLYEQGNRQDLAQQEREEIVVIESFLPRQLDKSEIESAVVSVIAETGAAGIKDMGRVMAANPCLHSTRNSRLACTIGRNGSARCHCRLHAETGPAPTRQGRLQYGPKPHKYPATSSAQPQTNDLFTICFRG
jgi:uncharacterized protein YqeY